MRVVTLPLVLALALAATSAAQTLINGPVIISEILYNTSGDESGNEWIELYNTDTVSIDIGGWVIDDEDTSDWGAIPLGTMIGPGEAIVLCPDANGAGTSITAADFHAAWGAGFTVIPVPWGNLSNSPDALNEILQLLDGTNVQDEVNYDDGGTWPNDPGDRSIYLRGDSLEALDNDDGANWANSVPGVAGAFTATSTVLFPGVDKGSPGFVDASTVAWAHDVTCSAGVAPATVDVDFFLAGGGPGNSYFLAVALQHAGAAPSGPFFGIDITLNELLVELTPPLIGALDAAGSRQFGFTFPGFCPLGVAIDCVALEFASGNGSFIQASTATTINL